MNETNPNCSDSEEVENVYSLFNQEALMDVPEEDTVYAYTLNPNPKVYKSVDVNKQYSQIFMLLLQKAPKVFKHFSFTPELTQQGNIHIHGWFTIKDKVKYYKWFLPKSKCLGFVVVKNKVDEKWYEYIEKDMDFMNEIIEDLPVPYTHKDTIPYLKQWNEKRKCASYARYVTKSMKGPPVKRLITDYIEVFDIGDDSE